MWGAAVDQLLADEQYAIGSGPSVSPAAQHAVAGNTLWALTDHLGSVRDLVDNNGVIREHNVYDSFGRLVLEVDYNTWGQVISSMSTEAVDTLFGYTARDWDADVGLQYNRARWYNPATGRWLSQDPIGFNAGDANLYRYVGNRPNMATDPSGLEEAYVYIIERKIDGKWVVYYVGSANDYYARLNDSNHSQAGLIEDSDTRIRVQKYEVTPDVGSSRRQSYLSALNEAKRAAEQPHIEAHCPINNKIRAADPNNVPLWTERHNVTKIGRPRIVKNAGATGIRILGIAGDLASIPAGIDELRGVTKVEVPLRRVFEDEDGVFIYHQPTWFSRGKKEYLTGENAGQTLPTISYEDAQIRRLWNKQRESIRAFEKELNDELSGRSRHCDA